MKAIIRCELCNLQLGTITKEEITESDIADFLLMFTCDCGECATMEIVE